MFLGTVAGEALTMHAYNIHLCILAIFWIISFQFPCQLSYHVNTKYLNLEMIKSCYLKLVSELALALIINRNCNESNLNELLSFQNLALFIIRLLSLEPHFALLGDKQRFGSGGLITIIYIHYS